MLCSSHGIGYQSAANILTMPRLPGGQPLADSPATIDVDGRTLEARRIPKSGPGVPVLVFLHDGLGCVATWRDLPDRLAARTGLAAFVYSRAGYGASVSIPLPRPLDYEHREALDVLPRLLDVAGIDRCVLVGHSDGATMALIHAASAPAPRVNAIVAIAPHVFNEARSIDGIRRTFAAFRSGDLRARLARLHGDNVDCAFHGWADTWLHPEFRRWSITRELPKIRVPVLVIQGEADEYGSLAQVGAIVEGVSGPAETLVLPGCGHAPHRERATETEDAIAAFLHRHVARRTPAKS